MKDGSISSKYTYISGKSMRTPFLVHFYISVLDSVPQQGNLRLNFNNLIYTHQNLMGPKKTKNRLTILQHMKNLDLDKLLRNYDIIYKTGQIQKTLR